MSVSYDIDAHIPKDGEKGAIPPIQFIDLDDDEQVLAYANSVAEALEEPAIFRSEWQRENLARYKGFYCRNVPQVGSRNAGLFDSRSVYRFPRIGLNYTRNFVDQIVAKTLKIEPNTIVVPNNQEFGDKQSSVVAKKVIDSIKYAYDIRSLRIRLLRRAKLFGEAFLYIGWDKTLGEIKSSSKEKLKKAKEEGVTLGSDEVEYYGDVCLKVLDNDNVELIPGPDGSIMGCIITEYLPLEEVQEDYKDRIKAEDITATEDSEYFDYDVWDYQKYQNRVCVKSYYYRNSKWLPNGLYFKVTPNVVLEKPQDSPIPWTPLLEASKTGNLPIEILTDIDIEGNLHGWSSLMDINPLQVQLDKLTTLMLRNIFLYSHPKWFVPRGGCNYEQLSDGTLIVQTSGPQEPKLVSFQTITQEIFTLWERFPTIMGQLTGVFEHSMGEAPTGTRSASQLMIYDEKEEEQRASFRKKVEQFVVGTDAKILAICAEYYKDEDKRLLRIMGKNTEWLVEPFDVKDLQKDYVIRVLPSNAFPDNKYARIRTLLELYQVNPNNMSFEQLMEAIDFGQHEKFIDYARAAIITAEAENDLMMEGKPLEEPALYEDLIAHWRVHCKVFQSRAFKLMSPEAQKNAEDHMLATEGLMKIKSLQNPAFKGQLIALPMFPLFYAEEIDMGGTTAPMAPEPMNVNPESIQSLTAGTNAQTQPVL